MRTIARCLLLGYLLCVQTIVSAQGAPLGQYFPEPILLDGDPNPDGLGVVDNVTKVNVSIDGTVAFEGDDEGSSNDEFLFVDGGIVIRDGTPAVGTGGTFLVLDGFTSYRHVNLSGDVVFTSTLGGVATTLNSGLHLNNTKVLQEGEPAGGIPGRLYSDFRDPSLTDSGQIFVEVDLDGPPNDDEVIYLVSGGGAAPLPMNGSSSFREGALIVGGPLDGEAWDLIPFTNSTSNELGTFITDGDLEETGGTTFATDDVLVRKRAGQDYELLLRAGDTLPTGLAGPAPFESISDVTLADMTDDWAIVGVMDDSVTGIDHDSVVIASLAGSGPMVITQEGQNIAALTGVPGTFLDTMAGACINSQGEILILAAIGDNGVDVPPYDEALFLWEAGSLALIMTDETPIPSRPGVTLTDITSVDVVLNDQGRIFFQGTAGTLDGIFEAILPGVAPVENLLCVVVPSGTEITASWTLPASANYDGIRVLVGGSLVTTLAPNATTYTTLPATQNGTVVMEIEPFLGPDKGLAMACASTITVIPPDAVACRMPTPPSPIDSALAPVVDTLSFVPMLPILDVSVSLEITHTAQGNLDIEVGSPLGTTVVLTTDNGSASDNVDATFADFGVPISPSNLNAGLLLQPEGPGSMADFRCEVSGGTWTLTVSDDTPGDTGTLDEWCVHIYEDTGPGIDCCPRPTGLTCTNLGACGGPGVQLSWTLNSSYDELELTRTQGASEVTIPLTPGATSFVDTTAPVGAIYAYTLGYRCAGGGTVLQAESCSVLVDTVGVPEIEDFSCEPDPCGTDAVTLTWTNLALYDSLTLERDGTFFADVTGASSFADTSPLPGTSTYDLIATCGGFDAESSCSVVNLPQAVTDVSCDPDFCANTITIQWNPNGVNYDSLILERGGVFVADVTGFTSFTDSSPVSGISTYTLVAGCIGGTAEASCEVENAIPLPDDFHCSAQLGSDSVQISWTEPIAYDSVMILRNGMILSPSPLPGDTSYVDQSLMAGTYTYTLVVGCAAGTGQVECTTTLFPGDRFLLIPKDGALDGVGVHDPSTGDFLGNIIEEGQNTLEIFVANNAILGPRAPGDTPVIYVTDPAGSDYSILRYELDGTFVDGFVTDSAYDGVFGAEFDAETLYFSASGGPGIVEYDIGTELGSSFISSPAPADQLLLPDGRVLVADQFLDQVVLYDAGGLNPLVLVDSQNSAIADPTQLAARANGNYIVGTAGSDAVIEFDLAGTVIDTDVVGFNVQGVHELASGLILLTSDTQGNEGVYTLDSTSGILTLVHDEGTEEFYYIEEVVSPSQGFIRGNCNSLDAFVNLADAVYLLSNLFPVDVPPVLNCRDACDTNDDGTVNISDAVTLLSSLFGTPAVPLPTPNASTGCGADLTPDGLGCLVAPPGC